jgi:5'-phosphate synthase pdxT subunit
MAYLLGTSGLRGPLGDRLAAGMPIFGTCAGLIMLAAHIDGGRSDQWSYGALDVTVRRNGYGRQVASFEAFVDAPNIGLVPGVFIRAPRVTTWGDDVEVLATYDHGDGSHPVLMRQGGALGCSFHPELTDSTSIHRYFLDSFD